ncbi:unnamed protein product, partial [Cuscuta europaea]
MARLSNQLLRGLNIMTFLISITILICGIWLSRHQSTPAACDRLINKLLIVAGAFILVLSVMGFLGSTCFSCLLWTYVILTSVIAVLFFCFAVFAFAVTNDGAAEAVSGKGFMEFRLGNYSGWLQKRVEKHWYIFRSCIQQSLVCRRLMNSSSAPLVDVNNHLKSGCCNPPSGCHIIKYQNPTNSSVDITECRIWSNDQNILCYDCQSCKAGLIKEVKRNWNRVAIANMSFIAFLVVVLVVGCCAITNHLTENSRLRYR